MKDDKPAEYIAQFKTVQQISPDDWELATPSLKVTDSTTIGEIRQWMDNNYHAKFAKEFKVITLES